MKRLLFLCLVSALLFLSYPLPIMGGEVRIGVRVILASHKGRDVDTSLQDLQRKLSQMFNYSSYRLLRERTFLLMHDQMYRLSLTENKELHIKLLQEQGGEAEIAVKIMQRETEVFKTKVMLRRGGALLIGGPKHEEGVLILAIDAQGL